MPDPAVTWQWLYMSIYCIYCCLGPLSRNVEHRFVSLPGLCMQCVAASQDAGSPITSKPHNGGKHCCCRGLWILALNPPRMHRVTHDACFNPERAYFNIHYQGEAWLILWHSICKADELGTEKSMTALSVYTTPSVPARNEHNWRSGTVQFTVLTVSISWSQNDVWLTPCPCSLLWSHLMLLRGQCPPRYSRQNNVLGTNKVIDSVEITAGYLQNNNNNNKQTQTLCSSSEIISHSQFYSEISLARWEIISMFYQT